MKQIELKTLTVEDEQLGNLIFDYRNEFLSLLKKPTDGIDLDRMELSIRTIGKIKRSPYILRLEQDEWLLLSNALKAAKWSLVLAEVFDMIQEVLLADEEKDEV